MLFFLQVVLFKYDDEEYESLIKADSGNWTRAETDYLFELLDRFDLRWPVITDRFEVHAWVYQPAHLLPKVTLLCVTQTCTLLLLAIHPTSLKTNASLPLP